jgi:hypothetical protein
MPSCRSLYVPRDDAPAHLRKPGTWKPLKTDKSMSASFTCPKCGQYGALDGHGIHTSGSVWLSVVCPADCGFHGFIELEGWPP